VILGFRVSFENFHHALPSPFHMFLSISRPESWSPFGLWTWSPVFFIIFSTSFFLICHPLVSHEVSWVHNPCYLCLDLLPSLFPFLNEIQCFLCYVLPIDFTSYALYLSFGFAHSVFVLIFFRPSGSQFARPLPPFLLFSLIQPKQPSIPSWNFFEFSSGARVVSLFPTIKDFYVW